MPPDMRTRWETRRRLPEPPRFPAGSHRIYHGFVRRDPSTLDCRWVILGLAQRSPVAALAPPILPHPSTYVNSRTGAHPCLRTEQSFAATDAGRARWQITAPPPVPPATLGHIARHRTR